MEVVIASNAGKSFQKCYKYRTQKLNFRLNLKEMAFFSFDRFYRLEDI